MPRTDVDVRAVRRAVRRWSARHRRPLPWVGERDPYRVLVSEVMLQQTQASRVVDHYRRFLARFPTVEALASADGSDVIVAWSGLGYNRRALALQRAARAILERGAFPDTIEDLQELPGVGPYTARAVAAFAFGRSAAAVDANVRRVITRVTGALPGSDVQCDADAWLAAADPGAWNQALMDLGAAVCRARSPSCEACPLEALCAYRAGVRPSVSPSDPTPFRETNRFVRGRVVETLRHRRSATAATLASVTEVSRSRVDRALVGLERDGLVTRTGRSWRLGPQRARARRASRSVTT